MTFQNYKAGFTRGLGKQIRSTLPAIGRTPQHTPLLTVKLHLAEKDLEAVVDIRASTSVVGKCLARKLRM